MSKRQPQHPPYAEMLFEAIHSAGRGYVISRQKIVRFIDVGPSLSSLAPLAPPPTVSVPPPPTTQENFQVDTASAPFKASFKKALEKKLEEGLVARVRQVERALSWDDCASRVLRTRRRS
ncbi:hypothetical protein JCM21900_002214 [Sporobolomyces salmonicolor]